MLLTKFTRKGGFTFFCLLRRPTFCYIMIEKFLAIWTGTFFITSKFALANDDVGVWPVTIICGPDSWPGFATRQTRLDGIEGAPPTIIWPTAQLVSLTEVLNITRGGHCLCQSNELRYFLHIQRPDISVVSVCYHCAGLLSQLTWRPLLSLVVIVLSRQWACLNIAYI